MTAHAADKVRSELAVKEVDQHGALTLLKVVPKLLGDHFIRATVTVCLLNVRFLYDFIDVLVNCRQQHIEKLLAIVLAVTLVDR